MRQAALVMKVGGMPWKAQGPWDRCANCGCPPEKAQACIPLDDGEWACSVECYDEHEAKGCPFDHGVQYRPCPHLPVRDAN